MFALLIPFLGALGAPGHMRAGACEEVVFVELACAKDRFFVGEVVELRVRFGFERRFLAERAVQPFQHRLDLPARLELPWLAGLPCAEALPVARGAGPEFALGDGLARAADAASEERDGAVFDVVEIVRPFRASCAGTAVFSAATLRYAYATRFAEDVFAGRVPADRVDASVTSAPLALEVRPLPEEGRPLDFTGAVGRFELRAAASETRVRAGEGFTLEVTVTGAGDLDGFELPRLDLAGLRVRGRIENRARGARVLTLDLAAEDERVTEVPALALSYFDPDLREYRTARSAPVPLLVLPAAAGAPLEPPLEPPDGKGATDAREIAAAGALAIAAVFLVLALLLRGRRRSGS